MEEEKEVDLRVRRRRGRFREERREHHLKPLHEEKEVDNQFNMVLFLLIGPNISLNSISITFIIFGS